MRFVAEKKEAFQSFDPDEHFAGYPLSLDPEIIDEPVDGPDNVAAPDRRSSSGVTLDPLSATFT